MNAVLKLLRAEPVAVAAATTALGEFVYNIVEGDPLSAALKALAAAVVGAIVRAKVSPATPTHTAS